MLRKKDDEDPPIHGYLLHISEEARSGAATRARMNVAAMPDSPVRLYLAMVREIAAMSELAAVYLEHEDSSIRQYGLSYVHLANSKWKTSREHMKAHGLW